MKFYLALWLGKIINLLIRMIDKSRGSNLSGEKAIVVDPQMIKKFKGVDCSRMLFITGTNGKSTTNNLVYHIFRENGYDVVSNLEGANLMAGIATALIKRSSIFGRIKGDFFIFEVDERYLASVYALLPAENILVTNLQKDQVHRNGDPDFIYRKISPVVEKAARVFLNGDEPRSFALSSLNPSYVTYGVEKHSEAFMKDGTFPTMACPVCHGSRLKPEVLSILVGGKNICQVTALTVRDCLKFFADLQLSERQQFIAKQVLKEICARLQFLNDVGLDYLTLDRSAGTLSGGEAQRIRLATQIGSGLTGVLYILDEPSIGLHQRDNGKLLETLKHLRDLGNTLIVVEHDEETMYAADQIIDIGPGAGEHGGEVVAQGTAEEIKQVENSVTGTYLSGRKFIPVPKKRRQCDGRFLTIKGARANNLKNIDVKIPLGVFTVVTGVSGSGKSTLINDILYNTLGSKLNGARLRPAEHDTIEGIELTDKVINIDQSPIGRTPRSNPATYTGVFDFIRELFSQTNEAKMRGYKAGRFSFNVKGGRCEACKGDGMNKIEMNFLPDVYVPCEVCHGARYNRDTLEVHYKGKNIAEVLDMTVSEACEFFKNLPRIYRKLEVLEDVGLGYIHLGQAATTLSGGEAQRVKLCW